MLLLLNSPSGLFLTFPVRYITCRKRLFNLTDTDCKALVVYGSNLSSTVGFSITKKIRMNTALPSHIEQMITGLLLSDGYLRYGKDRKSTRLNSSHLVISYAVFCLKKK